MWGMPDHLAEEKRRVGVTPPNEKPMVPADIAFWNIVLDNFSGAFLDAVSDLANEAWDERERKLAEAEDQSAVFPEARYE